mgnify:CR=1 FL=1
MAVQSQTMKVAVGGLKCASCVKTVEGVLENSSGIQTASLNLASGVVRIEYLPNIVDFEFVQEILESNGYKASKSEGVSE